MGRRKIMFEKLPINPVDGSLKDTFGETVAEIIYKHFKLGRTADSVCTYASTTRKMIFLFCA
jgi:hypothetical protein